jgi:hypothetical protein
MTDDDIVGIRMTTPGDIKAFARAIEKKVKGYNMVKIGDRVINISNITYIIDRHVFFNNGTSWVATEPEIQDLLASMFNEPRKEDAKVDSNDTVPTRNRTNKPKRVSK